MKTQTLSILISLATIGCSSKFDENDDNIIGNSDDTGTEVADEGDEDADEDDDEEVDLDGDGVSVEDGDCDDEDENISPEADEICDGIDNDCDDVIDETFDSIKETYYEDADDDEFGNPEVSEEFCPEQNKDGWVTDNTDCDDTRANVYPGADEDFTDEIDNDCDDDIDERFDIEDVVIEDLPEDINYGTPSSLAVDGSFTAHIAFEADGDVMYTKVTEEGDFSEPEIISAESDPLWVSGTYIDTEVSTDGRVHVGYVNHLDYDFDGERFLKNQLYYAKGGAGTTWTANAIDGHFDEQFDIGRYVDLEIHESEIMGFNATTASFAYYDGDRGNARVADVLIDGGTPITTPIGSGFPPEWTEGLLVSAQYTSLGLSSDGTHYIAWYDPSAELTFSPQIQYSKYTWDPTGIVPEGWDLFSDGFTGIELSALLPSDIDFEDTLVETQTNGLRIEMTNGVDDTAEVPCVAYIDSEINALKFGCEGVALWAGVIQTLPIEGYIPSQPDLAISAGDEYFISFYNQTTRDLMLASKRKDSEWEIITVDSDGDVGQASSIDIGDDGSIHISYYDATNGVLRYARGF